MRIRVLLEPRFGGSYEQILALAKVTEESGFDAFFRSDHLMGVVPDDPGYQPTDSWTTLAGLARETSRVRLGTLVTASTYRRPGLFATQVATIDAMSGGRVELGIGTGWYEREHQAFGIPFRTMAERFERLDETLAILKGLWTVPPGEAFSFEGKHFQIDRCAAPARHAQSPHPPIVVGGGGPRKTPALAARYADEFNGTFPNGAPERYARFREACERIGRDPATARLSIVIPVFCGADQSEVERRKSVSSPRMLAQAVSGSPDAVVERLAELGAEGADTVYFHIFDIDDLDHIRLLGKEVVPRIG